MARYGWTDFEVEPDMTADGSGDEDKYFITIWTLNDDGTTDEEVAVIVHRTCNGKFPIDGYIAAKKRKDAQMIVDALNGKGASDHYETAEMYAHWAASASDDNLERMHLQHAQVHATLALVQATR